MAKRKRKTAAPHGSATPAERIVAIRKKIAEGRSMGALKAAKELVKYHAGEAEEAVLREAYEARVEALVAADMEAEAVALTQVARQRFPDTAALWDRLVRYLAVRQGEFGDVLCEWRSEDLPPDRRAELGRLLESHLRDPAWVAKADELPLSSPLRQAAIAVQRALAEAADGALSADAREALRRVSRRSPLAPWRHFVLALAAFHAHDDKTAGSHLQRIPDHAAPAPLRSVLQAIIEGSKLTEPAAIRLARRVRGETAEALAAVQQLRKELDRSGFDFHTCKTLLAALAGFDQNLAQRFYLLAGRHGVSWPLDAQTRRLLGSDAARLAALATGDCELASFHWLGWLYGPANGLSRLDDIELSLALDFVCEPLALSLEGCHDLGLFGSQDLDQPKVARDWAEMLLSMGEDNLAAIVAGHADLVTDLRVRCGDEPEHLTGTARLLYFAWVLDPSIDRFDAMCRRDVGRRGAKARRRILLEAWAKLEPEALEPLLRLTADAEQRSALRQAEGYVSRAVALAGSDDRVRRAQVRVLLGNLHRHVQQGKAHLCRQDLSRLQAAPGAGTTKIRVYLLAATRVVTELETERMATLLLEPAQDDPLVQLSGGATAARAMCQLVRAIARSASRVIPPFGDNLRQRLQSLVQLYSVAKVAGDWVAMVFDLKLDLKKARIEDLPSDPAGLLELCELADRADHTPLLYFASGAGLLHEATRLPRFLYYRATALRGDGLASHEDYLDCLSLAWSYAERYRDVDALRLLRSHSLHGGVDIESLSDDEAAAVLSRERQLQGARRTSKGRRKPRQRLGWSRLAERSEEL